jgi:exosome complex component RRP45
MGFEYVQPSSTLGGSSGGMGQPQDENQKLLSNRILRILERTLLNGGAIDAEALCVQSGKWVWRLHVDVTVLDHGGNLVDACILSAVAALRHFRKPEVEIQESGGPKIMHSDEREPTPLPLHHTPLTITFALYSDPSGLSTTVSALIDPSHREELVMDGTATFSFNKYGEMCSLDFPGGCELKSRQLITCASLGKRKCMELCDLLENALIEADNKSTQERLNRLKLVSNGGGRNIPLPPIPDNVPFVERTDFDRDSEFMEIDQDDLHSKAAAIAAAEEESYRIQALDFAHGHVAAKVKENVTNKMGEQKSQPTGSLMAALLKSAGKDATVKDNPKSSSLEVKVKSDISITAAKSNAQIQPMNIDDSDDDEEEVVMLQSEFATEVATQPESDTAKPETKSVTRIVKTDSGDDDEVDDLAMAIKKKKTKKKKVKK